MVAAKASETCMAPAVDDGSPLGIRVALAAPFPESFVDDVVRRHAFPCRLAGKLAHALGPHVELLLGHGIYGVWDRWRGHVRCPEG